MIKSLHWNIAVEIKDIIFVLFWECMSKVYLGSLLLQRLSIIDLTIAVLIVFHLDPRAITPVTYLSLPL